LEHATVHLIGDDEILREGHNKDAIVEGWVVGDYAFSVENESHPRPRLAGIIQFARGVERKPDAFARFNGARYVH
jgi:hypothetical protein